MARKASRKALDNGFRWSVICPDYQKHGFRSYADAERWVSRLKHCAHDHQIVEVPYRTPDVSQHGSSWHGALKQTKQKDRLKTAIQSLECGYGRRSKLRRCADEPAELP